MNGRDAKNTSPNPQSDAMHAETKRLGLKLAGLLAGLALFLGLGAWLYLSHRESEARIAAQQQLAAIADLKLGQISNWREERLCRCAFFLPTRVS